MTTERDFKGHFADVLADNMATADTDRERVASAFDDAATGLDQVIQSASEENNRRRLAREYFQRIEDRNWLEKGWDWIFGQEPPPRLEQNPAPTITTTSSSVDTHDNPPPGTGDNTGVSSAEPSALRDGSSKLSGFCDDLDSPISDVRASMSEYQASCHWGTFNMSGPLQAVDSWVEQTRNDVGWLNTIAAAFEAAGQDGSGVA